MPKELEQKLKREAAAKGYGEKRSAAYVYGTLRKTGWIPSSQRTHDHLKSKGHTMGKSRRGK